MNASAKKSIRRTSGEFMALESRTRRRDSETGKAVRGGTRRMGRPFPWKSNEHPLAPATINLGTLARILGIILQGQKFWRC